MIDRREELAPWRKVAGNPYKVFFLDNDLVRRIDLVISRSSTRSWSEWGYRVWEAKVNQILDGTPWIETLTPEVRKQITRDYGGEPAPWQKQMRNAAKGIYITPRLQEKIDTALASPQCAEVTSWGQWAWATIADAVVRQEQGEKWIGDIQKERIKILRNGITSFLLKKGLEAVAESTGISPERLEEIFADPCKIEYQEFEKLKAAGCGGEWYEQPT